MAKICWNPSFLWLKSKLFYVKILDFRHVFVRLHGEFWASHLFKKTGKPNITKKSFPYTIGKSSKPLPWAMVHWGTWWRFETCQLSRSVDVLAHGTLKTSASGRSEADFTTFFLEKDLVKNIWFL
jgi:hypothetical protein